MRTPDRRARRADDCQDARGVERIHALVAGLAAEGRTVIAISHDMRFVAEAFERVAVLRRRPARPRGSSVGGVRRSQLADPCLDLPRAAGRGASGCPSRCWLDSDHGGPHRSARRPRRQDSAVGRGSDVGGRGVGRSSRPPFGRVALTPEARVAASGPDGRSRCDQRLNRGRRRDQGAAARASGSSAARADEPYRGPPEPARDSPPATSAGSRPPQRGTRPARSSGLRPRDPALRAARSAHLLGRHLVTEVDDRVPGGLRAEICRHREPLQGRSDLRRREPATRRERWASGRPQRCPAAARERAQPHLLRFVTRKVTPPLPSAANSTS